MMLFSVFSSLPILGHYFEYFSVTQTWTVALVCPPNRKMASESHVADRERAERVKVKQERRDLGSKSGGCGWKMCA